MNEITLSGTIEKIELSHSKLSEKFYCIQLKSFRSSGTADHIKCIASEVHANNLQTGMLVNLSGNVRTRNFNDGGKSRLDIYVFVNDIECLDPENFRTYDNNCVLLDGFICKKPIARDTPLGRKIADVLLAVNGNFGKSSYIPCIIWGRNADRVAMCEVGTEIKLKGRLQSREYVKKLEDGAEEIRTAYEVSVMCFEEVS